MNDGNDRANQTNNLYTNPWRTKDGQPWPTDEIHTASPNRKNVNNNTTNGKYEDIFLDAVIEATFVTL